MYNQEMGGVDRGDQGKQRIFWTPRASQGRSRIVTLIDLLTWLRATFEVYISMICMYIGR